jgi:hypothetical protein
VGRSALSGVAGKPSPETQINGGCPQPRSNTERRFREHHHSHARLFKMAIRSQRLRQMAPLHHYKRQAVGEAPVLVGPRPIKLHSGVDQDGLERYHHDAGVRVGSAVTLGCNAASARVGKAVQSLPKHRLSRHDAAPGPDHELVPRDRVLIILISLARKRHPKGSIHEVGCHYRSLSFVGLP